MTKTKRDLVRTILEDGHLKLEGDENTMDLDEAIRHLARGHICRSRIRAYNPPEIIQRVVTHKGRSNVARTR